MGEILSRLQAQSHYSSGRLMGYQEQGSDIDVGTTDDCAFPNYVTGKMITGHSDTGQFYICLLATRSVKKSL